MNLCDLRNTWQLRHEELHCDKDHYPSVICKEDGWMRVDSLPCDVHVPLIENGVIDDPVVSDNYLKCEWIESKSWWFKKEFSAGRELLQSHNSELVVEGLDVKADLFLNGYHLGHHSSAMYPFRRDVRDCLREGDNVLAIRVTSGLEHFSDLDLAKIKDFISCEYKRDRAPRGDNRRVFVRKPQYVYGWDWCPRIATCGIMGDARIEASDEIAVRHVKFTTRVISTAGRNLPQGDSSHSFGRTVGSLQQNAAQVTIEAEIDNLEPTTTLDASVEVEISLEGVPVQSSLQDVFLTSGLNYVTFELTIDNPKLWWPNGMGEQNLYTVQVRATTANGNTDSREFKAGIRTVRLNTDRIDRDGRMFAFEVNGITTFCKGGNWETPDCIYGRVTDHTYETLLREAQQAHFNMLRVNGVNAYERDYFYECCDRFGILVWQDFCFSCAAYPDELDWFRREAENEVDYQTKRLRNHPCIALWCGNNECNGLLLTYQDKSYWAGDKKPASPGGTILYNEIMPRIVRSNCPDIPYWNSSPFGGVDLQSNECGDRHHWDCFMNEDIEKRIIPEEYDEIACKFVSEFGCVGPTRKSSLLSYYGSESVEMDDAVWKLHTNTFEKGTLAAAIRKHYSDPDNLSLEKYLLYGGLFQGSMLEYALDSMRCAENNYGALIWSYNDAWGEVGWGIIDYYLTRKLSYYFVKRALAPRRLILRSNADVINVFCTNDTPESAQFDLERGYTSFEGVKRDAADIRVTLEPWCKAALVARMNVGTHSVQEGLYYATANADCGIIPATLRQADFRTLQLSEPTVKITEVNELEGTTVFTVQSDRYAHAVHFGLDDTIRLSDEYFDLLPAESRQVTVYAPSSVLCGCGIEASSVY